MRKPRVDPSRPRLDQTSKNIASYPQSNLPNTHLAILDRVLPLHLPLLARRQPLLQLQQPLLEHQHLAALLRVARAAGLFCFACVCASRWMGSVSRWVGGVRVTTLFIIRCHPHHPIITLTQRTCWNFCSRRCTDRIWFLIDGCFFFWLAPLLVCGDCRPWGGRRWRCCCWGGPISRLSDEGRIFGGWDDVMVERRYLDGGRGRRRPVCWLGWYFCAKFFINR